MKLLLLPGKLLGKIIDSAALKWLAATPIRATLFLVSVVVFWSFPSYDVATVLHESDCTWDAIFLQAQHPFTDHAELYDPESHQAQLGVRVVPALLMHALGATTIERALFLQFALLVLFYFLLLRVFERLLDSRPSALLFALPFCFVISGHVYITDFGGMFDTLALDLLLLAVLCRRTILVVPVLLLAYFTDVRALLASASIILLNVYLSDRFRTVPSIIRASFSGSNLYIVFSWLLYFVLLEALRQAFGLYSTPANAVHYFLLNIPRTGYALYIGMEGFLILLAMVLAKQYATRSYGFTLLVFLNYLLFVGAVLCVLDISRSLAYLVVFQVLLLVVLHRSFSKQTVMTALGWIILVSLVYDEGYPLVAQLYRMAFITHTLSV